MAVSGVRRLEGGVVPFSRRGIIVPGPPGGPSETTGFGREGKAQGLPRAPHSTMTCRMLLCEWGENELHSCVPRETRGSGVSWVKSSERRYASAEGEAPAGGRFGVPEDK